MPPSLKCLTRGRFFTNDPSYQNVQWKPLLLTLAYAQALQYLAEEVSLPASSDPCPLAKSVVELRWCVERYITFSKQDILKDLGSAIHEAQGWDTGIPQADSIALPTMTDVGDAQHSPMKTQQADDTIPPLPGYQSEARIKDRRTPPADSATSLAMADVKDTQPSPTETPLADGTTVPSAEPNAETKKDLLTTWATSPTELENQVAPTARLVDKSASPPTPSGHPVKERQYMSTLTATMEILNLEAP